MEFLRPALRAHGSRMNARAIDNEQLLRQLNWRYAAKQFDPQRKISAADWRTLEAALRLTPSSGGLQPWKFIIVTDSTVRAKLTPASYGQVQINAASDLVVFAAKINFSEADVEAHLENVSRIRAVPLEALAPLRGMLVGAIIQGLDETARNAWARNQAYLALGNLLNSAALRGIDACPMEGFDRAQYDEVLDLKAQGLASAVIATLGYRQSTDSYASAPKVRFAEKEIFIRI